MLDEENDSAAPRSSKSLNRGRGQEITGVTLPAEGRLKGWEFGQGVRMACANVNGQFFALQVRTYVGPHVVFFCVFRVDMTTFKSDRVEDIPFLPKPINRRENVPVVALIYGKAT